MKSCCKSQPLKKYAMLPGRLILGVVFILAALSKFKDPAGFVESMILPNIPIWLPETLGTAYGYALPYAELLAGALLIIGLFTRIAAGLSTLMLLSFLIAFNFFSQNGLNKEIGYLAISLMILIGGAGMFSLDNYFKNRSSNDQEEDLDNEE